MINWENLSPNQKGIIAEGMAVNWLLLQKYEVFKNVCHFGKVDMIAIKDGVATFIDVGFCPQKKGSYQDPKKNKYNYNNSGLDIKYLYVTEDGNCYWRTDIIRLQKRICARCQREFEVREKASRKHCFKCVNGL